MKWKRNQTRVYGDGQSYNCLNITTITDIYNLCFIEYEDTNKLGVYLTGEDGRERYLILNKAHIVSLQVVYEQDIQLTTDTEAPDIMVI